jgi:hypothetical protein
MDAQKATPTRVSVDGTDEGAASPSHDLGNCIQARLYTCANRKEGHSRTL